MDNFNNTLLGLKPRLKEWIEHFDAGAFAAKDFDTQVMADWWDWFCQETISASKTKKLAPKVKQIAKSPKLDPEKVQVSFKNNCPGWGSLYDNFSISNLEDGCVLWAITPASSQTGMADVWGPENGWAGPLVEGSWADVLEFFGVK